MYRRPRLTAFLARPWNCYARHSDLARQPRSQRNWYDHNAPPQALLSRRPQLVHLENTKDGVGSPTAKNSVPDPNLSEYQNRFLSNLSNCRKARAAPGTRALDRTAVVTGGTSGIGYAVAKRLVLEGATWVVIVTRSESRGTAAIERIKEETGLADAPIQILEYDYGEGDSSGRTTELLKRLAATTQSPLNTFVHCAGISESKLIASGNAFTGGENKVLRTNLEVPMFLAGRILQGYHQLGHRHSRQRQATEQDEESNPAPLQTSFSCVLVSSLLANKGGYGASSYAAAKAGLIAFTRALSLEASESAKRFPADLPPFRANVVVPGYVDTPMLDGIKGPARKELQETIPLGRFATPDEVADAILFLTTNEYANNCVLNLDGGLSAT